MCRFEEDCNGNVPGSDNHCGVNQYACRIFAEKRDKTRALRAFGQMALVV